MPVFKAKINCHECGGLITWYLSKGNWRGNCNHYKKCSQTGTVLQTNVEEQLFPYFIKVAPKNERILKILEKTLKEDQSDEIKYHSKQREELNRIIISADKRIEGAYRDKLDSKMPVTLCEKIMAESNQEKESAVKALQQLSNDRTAYYEAGIAIHELALRAKVIYSSKKTTTDDKRLLLSYVFSNTSLNAGKINANYTFAFQFLAKWMPILNKNFELNKSQVNKAKSDLLKSELPLSSAARTRTWNHLLTHNP